ESERHIRLMMESRACTDMAVADLEPAADFLVAREELRDQIALLQPSAKFRMPPSLEFQEPRQPGQDDTELERGQGHTSSGPSFRRNRPSNPDRAASQRAMQPCR